MRSSLQLLSLFAGSCAAATTMSAQVDGDMEPLPIGPRVGAPIIFGDRAPITAVYNAVYNECPSTPAVFGNGCSYTLEDVSFDPGPWGNAYTGPRDVVQVNGMFQTAGWTGTPLDPTTNTPMCRITHLFEFYEPGNFTNAPMLANTTAIAIRAVPTNHGSGYAWSYTSEPFDQPVSLGTRVNVWVAIKATDPLTGYRIFDGNTGLIQPVGQTAVNYGVWLGRVGPPCVGYTTVEWGRDTYVNGPTGSPGDFTGCPLPQNCDPGPCTSACENRRTATSYATGARVHSMGLYGAFQPTPPVADITLCPVTDGVLSRAVSVTNTVRWVQLCLPAPVSDVLGRYLNIDTEGSQDDLAIALYDSAGALVATDADSGSGVNAQLTFGVGRAAGVGTGAQYDGRDGELLDGTYWLAVGPANTLFASLFTAIPTGTASGAASTVRIHTNLNAGGNLPAAVPPNINHYDFAANGPAWGPTTTDTLRGSTGDGNPNPNDDDSAAVLWSKFAIATPGADAFHYLDIDFGASDYGDNVAYLFDSAGSLVAFADDQIAMVNFLPAMSFGASIPGRNTTNGQPRAATNHADFAFAGQHGLLAPGTYYLATAAWPADVLTGPGGGDPLLGPNRRWHVRGLSSMNIGHTADFYTGSGFACDTIDFNNDGLFPDTLDIGDFLAVFGGGACSNEPNCGDIDYNNDGLFPDTLDIDALLSVFSGGPCLR